MAVAPLDLTPEDRARYLDVKRPDMLDDPEGDPQPDLYPEYDLEVRRVARERRGFLDRHDFGSI